MGRPVAALLVAAAASGQGKTTVTAALARFHRRRGARVRVFKTGPDFLDPMILAQASGAPVYQLDLWLGGEAHCRQLLGNAAGDADLLLVEGMMGLFDGDPSSADLARLLGIPVLAVIDAAAMAQTFGAIAHGLASYHGAPPLAGVFANRVGGDAHYRMLVASLPPGLAAFGHLPRDAAITLPERHLGLFQADEIDDLDSRIDRAAALLDPPPAPLATIAQTASDPHPPLLAGRRIAIARDAAFAFLYPANLDLLRALGAELCFFSPLVDTAIPAADALYLPGGYPELHLSRLAANRGMHTALRSFDASGRPIVAECGGMLYLLDALTDCDGGRAEMVGLLPGQATMQATMQNLCLAEVALPQGRLRGHSFHHSSMQCTAPILASTVPARGLGRGEPVYRRGRLTASYLHWYFPSSPTAAAALFLP